MSHIHIIDKDYRRRARIAHDMFARGVHAEVYEDFSEIERVGPSNGIVLTTASSASEIIDRMAKSSCELPVLVYSEDPATADIVEAMRSGALDFLEFPFEDQSLDRCLERVGREAERKLAQIRKRSDARASIAKLSPREFDVLHLLMKGGSNKSIAEKLGISSRTVEIHRANVMAKINAGSVAEAVRIGIYAGLDDDDVRVAA